MVLDSIPSQLAKENKKFVYGSLKKGARAKEFEMAIQWLVDAGIVVKIHMASKPSIPLKVYEDFGAFKLFCVIADCWGAWQKHHRHLCSQAMIFSKNIKGLIPNRLLHNN